MLSDFRFAFRSFRRSPGLIGAAILATALGVGANTAIFSVLQSTLLRPLPYRDPSRLVIVWQTNPKIEGFLANRLPVCLRNLVEWKKRSQSFSEMAAMQRTLENLTGQAQPEQVTLARITPNFLPLLGRTARIGRAFHQDEGAEGKSRIALLSDAFFDRRFGRDPHIVGRNLIINGASYTVIGVLPPDFHLPGMWQGLDEILPDVWAPMSGEISASENEATLRNYVFARLRGGVGLQAARSEMALIAQRLQQEYPKLDKGYGASVFPLSEEDVSPAMGRTVLALQVAVGFVLLIACANVANLLLARAAGRSREMAIRTSLGASRARLVRQALSESLLLSALGGGLGIVFAMWAMAGIDALAPKEAYHLHEAGLNWTVLLFATGTALASGILFGLAPALGAASGNLRDTLTEGGRAGTGRRARRVRDLLVVAEVAFALILLTGAGLMVRSLNNVLAVDLGFVPSHVLTMHVRLSDSRYKTADQVRAFCNQLLGSVRQIGGVESAAIATGLPLMDTLQLVPYRLENEPALNQGEQSLADYKIVSENYFQTTRTPLLRGRYFTAQDAQGDPGTVIINEVLARQLTARGGDPLGRGLFTGGASASPKIIVGVVAATHQMGLDGPMRPELFLPNRGIRAMALLLRTAGDPMAVSKSATAAIWAIDKEQPVTDIRTLEEQIHSTTEQRRFDTALFAGFAGLALLLAAVGLYGVLSYSVMLRTREIGVRMALGAQPGDVTRLVLSSGLGVTLAGVAIGTAGALGLTRLMAGMIFGVGASDPLTLAVVAGVLLVVATMASYIPSRRAARLDPARSLGAE